MGVRKLDNWLGDTWTLRSAKGEAPEMTNLWGKCDFARREIVYHEQETRGELSTIMHEVTHRLIDQYVDDPGEAASELRIQWVANGMIEFLEKVGVDLTPITGGKPSQKKNRTSKR